MALEDGLKFYLPLSSTEDYMLLASKERGRQITTNFTEGVAF